MYNIVKNDTTKSVGKRTIVNLNGVWKVADSIGADEMPQNYDHTVAVPGMMSIAEPEFKDVGEFETRYRQYCAMNLKMCTGGKTDWPINEEAMQQFMGISHQERNYFWQKRSFQAPKQHQFADLIVLKARFGFKVWINGEVVGENDSCYTSARYDITDVIRWGEENEILIRIGAHQGVLPDGNTCMEDAEHKMWYPGVWDDVELYCYDNPAIRAVQIAPKVQPNKILVETEVENRSECPSEVTLMHLVKEQDMETVLAKHVETLQLAPGELIVTQCEIELPDTKFWTPEEPNLYLLETSTDGDSELNRFGMREVYFRSDTKRFYLNHNVCFLRGGQIMLERFIEDPLSKTLPWDEYWVRALLGNSRRSMHWNVTKYSICDAPRKWLDIGDEEGLMCIPEFPIWCFNPEKPETFNGYKREYNLEWVLADTRTWVRDQRNHPSIIYWSAALETCAKWLGEQLIPTGRAHDLQKRAWQNSYNTPVDENDPLENHPYEFCANGLPDEWNAPLFDMLDLEKKNGHDRQAGIGTPGVPSGHAEVIAEYGWLWLTRAGEPGCYLSNTYRKMPYPVATPQERLETNSYLLAGITEYWRAHRNYAQVVYNAWLAGDMGPGYACVVDNYKDPRTLEFQPAFVKYVGEAFKPLGVYLEFWKREVQAGEERIFYIMLINDYLERKTGEVILTMEYDDEIIEIARNSFRMGANGSATVKVIMNVPEKLGKATMRATAITEDGLQTTSCRWVEVKEEIPPRPYGEW